MATKDQTVVWIMLGISCVFFLVAILLAALSALFALSATKTTGTVTEMREQLQRGQGMNCFAPTFKFRDATGKERSIESNTYSYPPRYKVGETISILYHPASPEDAQADNFFSLWGLPIIIFTLGILFVGIGLLAKYIDRIFGRTG